MKKRRRGFTLIEVLVVIGIILVLVGMAVVGYNQLDRTVASRSTRTTLHNLAAMEAELDAEAGPDFIEGPQPPAVYLTGSALAQPGDVTSGQASRYAMPQILRPPANPTGTNPPFPASTQGVMLQLMRSTKNKDGITGLPSKQLLKDVNGNPMTAMDLSGNSIPAPLIVDAWSDPIIFVPSGGLTGVLLTRGPNNTGGTSYTIRSSGVYPEPLSPQNLNPGSKDRPFWASAGQDGNFQYGDDNVYSFEN